MYNIDSVMVRFFEQYNVQKLKRLRIALVGESTRKRTKDTLWWRLKRLGFKTDVFTHKNMFLEKDFSKYDVILSVRGCLSEPTLIQESILQNKFYAILPCSCGGYEKKVIRYIQKYPIKSIFMAPESGVDKENKIFYDYTAWCILHNIY